MVALVVEVEAPMALLQEAPDIIAEVQAAAVAATNGRKLLAGMQALTLAVVVVVALTIMQLIREVKVDQE